MTIWNLGATLGNLIYGPLSEIFGRRIVYNAANVCFLVFLIAQTQSKTLSTVIALRCLNGLSVATTSLNPAIVGDLFPAEKRGRAQSLLSLMPLLGPIIGPIAGGAIAESRGWEWTFWFAAFMLAGFGIAFLLSYRETYDSTILRRKSARMRKERGNQALRCRFDDKAGTKPRSVVRKLAQALIRPFKIMYLPIFLLVALPACLLNSYVYLLATTMAEVFAEAYDFSETATGLVFLGIALGMALGALACSWILDAYSQRVSRASSSVESATPPKISPESRIPPTIPGFILAPAGLFIYGWTLANASHVPWIAPIIGTGVLGFALYLVSVPTITYIADSFGTYRASAMAALMTLRNALAILVPLAGPPLYARLSYGWGNSLLAFIAMVFVIAPFIIMRFGQAMRSKGKLMES